jgi:hypothetical protein
VDIILCRRKTVKRYYVISSEFTDVMDTSHSTVLQGQIMYAAQTLSLWRMKLLYVHFRDALLTAQQTRAVLFVKIQSAKNRFVLCHIKHVVIHSVISMAQQPLVDTVILIIETSRSHSDTPNSVGLLWTSDQPVAETTT